MCIRDRDAAKGGKLLLMSNVNSGAMYDFNIAFMDTWTQELGYTYEVIYGDSANDPAGNLNACLLYTSRCV